MGKYFSFNRFKNCKLIKINISYILLFFCYFPFEFINLYRDASKEKLNQENILLKDFCVYIGECLCFIPEFIYNKKYFLKDIKKAFPIIFILCFILLLIDFCEIFTKLIIINYNIFFYVDDFLFVSISLSIITYFAFKIKFYSHQYCGLFIVIISSLTRTIIQFSKFNTLQFIIIGLKIIKSLLKVLTYLFINDLIKKKYLSPLKVCFLIGSINSTIIFIIYSIVSLVSCNNSLYCHFQCKDLYYVDNIICYIQYLPLALKILYPLFITLYGLKNVLINRVINEYTILHIYIFLVFEDCIGLSYIYINFIDNSIIIFIIYFFTYIFLIIGNMIFYEIIELKFCGLNINLKKNIIKRAIEDNNTFIENNERIEISENYLINYDDVEEKEEKEENEEKV